MSSATEGGYVGIVAVRQFLGGIMCRHCLMFGSVLWQLLFGCRGIHRICRDDRSVIMF